MLILCSDGTSDNIDGTFEYWYLRIIIKLKKVLVDISCDSVMATGSIRSYCTIIVDSGRCWAMIRREIQACWRRKRGVKMV